MPKAFNMRIAYDYVQSYRKDIGLNRPAEEDGYMSQMASLNAASIKVLSIALVVMLGLFSWMLSPVLALLVLMVSAALLPVERRARAGLVIIGCLFIGLGAAFAAGDLPISQIAALKLMGSPYIAALSSV